MEEALVAAGKALDECRPQAAWALSYDELVSCVDNVHALAQQVAAVQLALVRQVDGRGLAVGEGATSTPAWLRDRHRISGAPRRSWSDSPRSWMPMPARRRQRHSPPAR